MRNCLNLLVRRTVLMFAAAGLLVMPGAALAIQDFGQVVRTVSWSDTLGGEIRVPICNPSQLAFARPEIELVSLPSGLILDSSVIKSVRTLYENGYYLSIKLGRNIQPNPDDEELKVTIRFPTSGQDAQMTRLEQTLCAFPALMTEVLAHEKTSTERRLTLSPSLSFPTGGNGEAAANGIIYRGRPLKMGRLINQVDFSLTMDKGSEEGADPNYFNLGVNFKKLIPFHWKKMKQAVSGYQAASRQLQTLRAANLSDASADARFAQTENLVGAVVDNTAQLKRAFFRDIEITAFSPRLELNFSGLRPGPVNNFINNSELQLRTASKAFLSEHLFWSLNLTPLGLESGVNLRNRDNVAQQGRGIVRLNTGGTLKVKFRFPCRDDLLADRIELEIRGVNRHLFNEESAFNPATKRNDLLVKGNKYSAQVDLRYVFGFTVPFPTRIFGFKLPNISRKPALTFSYKNGYFPPVYGFTNSFGLRFTLASGDQDNADDIRLSQGDLLKP